MDSDSASDYTVFLDVHYEPGWTLAPHRHTQNEISLVKAGACEMQLESQTLRLVAGQAFAVRGTELHGFRSSDGVEFVVLQFPTSDLHLMQELIGDRRVGVFALSNLGAARFVSMCHEIQQEVAGRLPLAREQCRAITYQIAVMLLRSLWKGDASELSLEQMEVVDAAVAWMHEHAFEDISVAEVARRAGLSPSHFRKIFRTHTGASPKSYLTALKLQASKSLLMQPHRTVTDISMQVGFGTPQQFATAFRKHVGVSPSEWRKAHMLPARIGNRNDWA